MMKDMAHRLALSESTYPSHVLIPMIDTYAIEQQDGVGPRNWVPDLFIEVGFPFETIVSTLQTMWYNNVAPFTGRRKGGLAGDVVYVLGQWYEDCVRSNTRLFGSEENMNQINELLGVLSQEQFEPGGAEALRELRRKILRAFR